MTDTPERVHRLLALSAWAEALALDVAYGLGMTPPLERPDMAGGADAILCAADVLWLAVADVDEADDAVSDAYSSAVAVLDDVREELFSARMQSGISAAGFCNCGEYVGAGPCPVCDRCEEDC